MFTHVAIVISCTYDKIVFFGFFSFLLKITDGREIFRSKDSLQLSIMKYVHLNLLMTNQTWKYQF
jgi:hypothetical protein